MSAGERNARRPAATRRAEPSARRSPARPTPTSRCSRRAPVERAAAPTLGFRIRVTDASGRPRVHDRAHRRDHGRALEAPLRPRQPRAPGRALRRARALGLDHDQLPLGAGRRAGPGVRPARPSSSSRSPAPTTSSWRRRSTSTGSPTATAPLRFHFNGTVFYEADDGRMQIVQIPWDRSPRFRMPIEVWRQTIDAAYPYRGWVPLHTETLERLAAAQGRARAADLRRGRRRAARRERGAD